MFQKVFFSFTIFLCFTISEFGFAVCYNIEVEGSSYRIEVLDGDDSAVHVLGNERARVAIAKVIDENYGRFGTLKFLKNQNGNIFVLISNMGNESKLYSFEYYKTISKVAEIQLMQAQRSIVSI